MTKKDITREASVRDPVSIPVSHYLDRKAKPKSDLIPTGANGGGPIKQGIDPGSGTFAIEVPVEPARNRAKQEPVSTSKANRKASPRSR